MNTIRNFIIVDDDPWNNKICAFNIKKTLREANAQCFLLPEKALAFLKEEFTKDLQPTILFLDINMPELNGWQFLEKFEKFGCDIKNNISIYMLSSSINPTDIEKAKANKFVKDFISKPLLHDAILMVANDNVTTKLNNF